MDGCVYRTKDGECDLYSEGGKFHAFCCNMNTCEGRKMTNYDLIKSKTPEELAKWIANLYPDCPPDYNCDSSRVTDCCDCWLDWLKQEAES